MSEKVTAEPQFKNSSKDIPSSLASIKLIAKSNVFQYVTATKNSFFSCFLGSLGKSKLLLVLPFLSTYFLNFFIFISICFQE